MTLQLTAEAVAVNTCVDVGRQSHHAVAIDRSGRRLYDRALPNDEDQLRALTPACVPTGSCGCRGSALRHRCPATQRPAPRASRWAACRDWPCGASRICTLVRPRPMPATLPCTPARRHHAPCPARPQGGLWAAHRALHAVRLRRRPDGADHAGPQPHPRPAHADPPRGLRGLWGRVLDIRQCWSCLPAIPRLRSWPDAERSGCPVSSESLPPRMHQRLAADIMPRPLLAMVVVPGTASAALVLPRLCAQLQTLHGQRSRIGDKIEQRPAAHPLYPIPTA